MIRTLALCSLRLLVIAAIAAPAFAGPRLWRYTDGRTFTAEYLWAGKESIYLKHPDGKEVQLALGALCNDDLAFVRTIAAKHEANGIIYLAPLIWEEFRSKNFTAQEAAKAGYYPLDSGDSSAGTLRLEFRRFGDPPKLALDDRVVLRLTTARNPGAGTKSRVRVIYDGKITGATSSAVPLGRSFDIPLSPLVLNGGSNISLEVRGGRDPVMIRTGESGAGPQLVVVKAKAETK